MKPTPMTDEQYTKLAHRIASKYAHCSDPKYIAYTFLPHTLRDFVEAICAARDAQWEQLQPWTQHPSYRGLRVDPATGNVGIGTVYDITGAEPPPADSGFMKADWL